MQRISVLLPEPLGPMMATHSPRRTGKSISTSTCRSPKYLFNPLPSIIGVLAAHLVEPAPIEIATWADGSPLAMLHSSETAVRPHPLPAGMRRRRASDLRSYWIVVGGTG